MVEPAFSLAEMSAPRRIAVASLFREAWGTERELAALYAAVARRTALPTLRTALEELAALKGAQIAALGALAPALDPDGGEAGRFFEPPGAALAPPERRADFFARAFDGERTLESDYREILVFLDDPARCPGLQPLAAESVRHRSLLRELYWRYT